VKELVIISGKGGTGKTSVTAAFAVLAGQSVLVDGDVDAADLHLILQPQVRQRAEFRSGHIAIIRTDACIGCGNCQAQCRFDAIRPTKAGMAFRVDAVGCEGCGVCVRSCPVKAIDFPERVIGEWYVSETRCGPMLHAHLKPGGENSGKLVTQIRAEARQQAQARDLPLLLLDGPPGIGCPVIASITGASQILVVTEPTCSGWHDLERVLGLARHFRVPAWICVNKWDINPAQTERIEKAAGGCGARIAGRIRYDRAVTDAQLKGCSFVESRTGAAAADLEAIWKVLSTEMSIQTNNRSPLDEKH